MHAAVARRAQRALPLLVGCASSLLVARGAGAQEASGVLGTERYQLRWVRESGAESCVSGAALARLLGQVVEPDAAPADGALVLQGVAEVASAPLRYRVLISVRDAASGELIGERELTTSEPKCAVLTPAVLLVLAMSVDPEAGRNGLPTAVADELRRGREEDVDVWPLPATPPGSVTGSKSQELSMAAAHTAAAAGELRALETTRKIDTMARPAVRARAERPSLRLALAGSGQVQPELSPGLLLGGRAPWSEKWAASFSALAWLPSAVEVEPSPYVLDDAIDFNAVQLSLAACRRLLGERIRLEACGGIGAGVRWLSAPALASQGNPYRGFVGPELGLSARWLVGSSWSVDAGAHAAGSLRDDSFVYVDHRDAARALFEPGWVSGFTYLGVGWEP
jgi:hypothetical protein